MSGLRDLKSGLQDTDDEDCVLDPSSQGRSSYSGLYSQNAQTPKDDKMLNVKHDVADVMNVMKSNMNSVLQRGEQLEDLQSRTDDLAINSEHFQRSARQTARRLQWQKWKVTIFIVVVVLLVIVLLIISTTTKSSGESSK